MVCGTVSVKELAEKMNLSNLTPDIDLSDRKIEFYDVNRPALQLTGFFDHFDSSRVQIVGYVNRPFRVVCNNVRSVKTPDDMKGLVLRSPTSAVNTAINSAMGATPVTISWGEVVVFAVAARVIALVDWDSSLMGVAYHFLGASFSRGLVFLISLYLYISASFAFRLIIVL